MKKAFITALVALAAIQGVGAANISGINFKGKVSANQVCSTISCSNSIKGNYNLKAEVDLDPAELAQFDSSTRIQIRFVNDAGLDVDVQLGDDSKYQNGDTSAKFKLESPSLIGDGTLVQNVSLNWSSGDMIVQITTSISATQTSPVTHSMMGMALDPKAAQQKDHDGYQQELAVEAEQGNATPIFTSSVLLVGTSVVSEKTVDNYDGSGSLKIKGTVTSTEFLGIF